MRKQRTARKLPWRGFPIGAMKNHHYRIADSGVGVIRYGLKSSPVAPTHARRTARMRVPVAEIAIEPARPFIMPRDLSVLEPSIGTKTPSRSPCPWTGVNQSGDHDVARVRNISDERTARLQRRPFPGFSHHLFIQDLR